jgi:hypothetical protein
MTWAGPQNIAAIDTDSLWWYPPPHAGLFSFAWPWPEAGHRCCFTLPPWGQPIPLGLGHMCQTRGRPGDREVYVICHGAKTLL